jgi:hypothetical protein
LAAPRLSSYLLDTTLARLEQRRAEHPVEVWFCCASAAVDTDQVRKGEKKRAAEGEIAAPPVGSMIRRRRISRPSVAGRTMSAAWQRGHQGQHFIGDNGSQVSTPLADGWGKIAGRRLTSTTREAMSTTAGGEPTWSGGGEEPAAAPGPSAEAWWARECPKL